MSLRFHRKIDSDDADTHQKAYQTYIFILVQRFTSFSLSLIIKAIMFENLNPFAVPSVQTEITDLKIYPIKSCRGISMKNSFLTKRGLDLDRRWMFVDAKTLKWFSPLSISLKPLSAPSRSTLSQLAQMT